MIGAPPEWYRLIQAAKYLQVPPWELARRPVWWTEVALTALSAENAASKARAKRKEQRSANSGGTQRQH